MNKKDKIIKGAADFSKQFLGTFRELWKDDVEEAYNKLLMKAPPHHTEQFIDYLRKNNRVLYEDWWWIVIENFKYGHPTAFAKTIEVNLNPLILKYGKYEWKVKPRNQRTVDRFHIHILNK